MAVDLTLHEYCEKYRQGRTGVMEGGVLRKCWGGWFGWSALLLLLVGLFYTPHSHASLLSNLLGVHQASLPKDSPRIELVGTLPADTELEVMGVYFSSICTEKELHFPGGDIANPVWRTTGTTSMLRQVVSSPHEASSFTQSVALQGGGRCEWKLTNIKLTMSLLPGHRLWQKAQALKKQYLAELPVTKAQDEPIEKDAFAQTMDLSLTSKVGDAERSDADDDIPSSFSPVYYPIYIYEPEDEKHFNVLFKSSLQQETSRWDLDFTRDIRFTGGAVMRIHFEPKIDDSYVVNVHEANGIAKVQYPDGTEFAYSIADLRLYPYGSPESRFNSLQHSSRLEDKKQLAKIYDSGISNVLEPDKAKAEVLYRELGEAGDMAAIDWLLYRAGWGYIKDGQYWLERAANLGNIKAKLELIDQPLSVILRGKKNSGKAKLRELQAWEELTQLAQQGIAEAKSQMALYQMLSCSPYYDATAALENFRQSVKIKPALALGAAQVYYYFNDDFAQAEEFWSIAAERDLYAAASLADVLVSDEHNNASKARYWLEKVTSQGATQGLEKQLLGKAYFQYASLLDKGEGGAVDANAALALYRQSLEISQYFSNDYKEHAIQRVKELEASSASQ